MSSLSSGSKTTHVSPRDSVGLILSQTGCLTSDQEHVEGTDVGVMEMTEVEYTHLQHLIQAHMDAQAGQPDGSDSRFHPATVMVKDATGSTVISPCTTTQAIDLSTTTEDHYLVMSGEKTPAPYGEVPGFVLARIRSEASPSFNSSPSPQKRSRSAARVCLEKRFNTMPADTPNPPDIHSAVLSNFLTILQSAETQEAILHPQMQKCRNPFEVSNPFVAGVFNPVTSICSQVIPHIIEPTKHQALIIPKSLSFSFHPERVIAKAHSTRNRSPTEEQQLVNMQNAVATPAASKKQSCTLSSQLTNDAKTATASVEKAAGNSTKRTQSCMLLSQRRDRHNSKERERRKRIRLCCDELNTLVPFCDLDTDKVTTLQWTIAYLRHISKTYGDTFKEEFQKSVTDEKLLLDTSSASLCEKTQTLDETLSVPFVVEQ